MGSSISDRFGAMGGGFGERSPQRKIVRLASVALGLLVMLFLLPNLFTYVSPGHVGIVIHRTGGGVDPTPLGPGLHMRNPLTTGIEEYPTFMQTLVLTIYLLWRAPDVLRGILKLWRPSMLAYSVACTRSRPTS